MFFAHVISLSDARKRVGDLTVLVDCGSPLKLGKHRCDAMASEL